MHWLNMYMFWSILIIYSKNDSIMNYGSGDVVIITKYTYIFNCADSYVSEADSVYM